MFTKKISKSRVLLVLMLVVLLFGSMASQALAQGKPSIKIVSPTEGQTITSTDIPVQVQVSNFKISREHVGLPDQAGEGHIHVMLDGMNMGVLFNFYTSETFTLPGQGIKPGPHTLIFDLATNTHEDMADTVQEVKVNYQPSTPKPAPASAAAGPVSVKVTSPADSATVGPKFTIQVQPTNFTPSQELEGKANIAGYGHYHIFVDMDMSSMSMAGGMMSMAGMVDMPGTNTIPVDLSAWPSGKHTITVEPVQNDHTPVQNVQVAMFTINLQGAAPPAAAPATAPTRLPTTGDEGTLVPLLTLFLGALIITGGLLLRFRATR
ncbi:MAG: LPXTG cell wall anchor domain-containing protein [Chloroflexi bacterium]|nr:LPXTG cell wall anchor domain-containing protein [Chloroflexota bacterium]